MIYVFDLTKLKALKKRTIITDLKFTIPGLILIVTIQYFVHGQDNFKLWLIVSLSFIPLTILRLLFRLRNFKKEVMSYEIITTEESIARKYQGKISKDIKWADLKYEIKNNGFIKISDRSVRGSKGMFLIPPEIENREELITEIKRHCN